MKQRYAKSLRINRNLTIRLDTIFFKKKRRIVLEKATSNASKKIEAYAVYVNGDRLFDSVSFQAALDSANSYRKLSATDHIHLCDIDSPPLSPV